MKPKTIQIINAIFWAIVTVGLNVLVLSQWMENGVHKKGLILGCIFFTVLPLAIGLAIHLQIKEANQ